MIDVRRLRILCELERRGTVAATAAALHLTPSAVSQQLAVLARETGVKLLDPDGRRVRLTAAALVLVSHAGAIFAELESAQADLAALAEGTVGTVRVAAFATGITGIVVPALSALRTTHPRLEITVVDVSVPECFDALATGDLDIVLTMAYPGGQPLDSRFSSVRLYDDPLDAVLPCDHPLASSEQVDLAALADDVFVGLTPGQPCHEITLGACAAAGFVPRIRHRSEDYGAIFGLIGAGCGVGLVPRLAGLTCTATTVIRPLAPPVPARPLFAAVRCGSETAPHLAAVLEAIQSAARDRAAEPATLEAAL